MSARPRLLLVELHHAGDAVMLIPLVRGAMNAYDVTVLCRPVVADLFRGMHIPPEIVEWDPPWMRGRKGTRAKPPDALFDAHFDSAASVWPDPRVHNLMARSGAKVRVGFSVVRENWYGTNQGWRRMRLHLAKILSLVLSAKGGASMLTTPLIVPREPLEHWRRAGMVAEALGVSTNTTLPWLRTTPNVIPKAVAAFFEKARREKREIWLVHPGARTVEKRWPLKYFTTLFECSASLSRAAILAVEEVEVGVWESGHQNLLVWPAGGWESLAAVMSASDVVLACDSFPAHLAAAMGTPVWTLFTSQDPRFFAAWSNAQRALAVDVCPHRPCLDRCVMRSTICRDQLSPEFVAAKIDGAVSASSRP